MSKQQGTVEQIVSRTVNGKNGTFTAYDYHIDGQKYGAGSFNARGVAEGDYVEFDVEMNGNYKNIAKNSMRKIAGQPAAAAVQANNAPVKYAGKTVNQKADEKDQRISRQSAFNTAAAFLKIAQEAGALPNLEKKATGLSYLRSVFFAEAALLYKEATGEEWNLTAPAVDGEAPKVPAKPKKPAAPAPAPAPVEDAYPDQDDGWEDDDIAF